MRITISGRNVDLGDRLKNQVNKKLGKLEKYFAPDTEARVVLSRRKDAEIIEVTIPTRNGFMRTQMNTIQERQKEASLARQKEAAGEKPEVLGFADMSPEEARKIKVDLYREGFFYYAVTHRTPNAPGSYLKSSLMDMMAWDATDHADLISQPLLVIAGEKADSRYMSEEAFAKATGTADKTLFIVPGATHIQTYFVKEYVEQIVSKIDQFFINHL